MLVQKKPLSVAEQAKDAANRRHTTESSHANAGSSALSTRDKSLSHKGYPPAPWTSEIILIEEQYYLRNPENTRDKTPVARIWKGKYP